MFIKKLKNVGGFSSLTRYINMLAGNATYIATTNSTAVAMALDASPYLAVWNWFNGSTTGFNGKYANPATLPSYIVTASSWSRGKGYLAIAFGLSPYVSVYSFNDSTGFVSKYSDPTTSVGLSGSGVNLDIDTGLISIASTSSPYISAYPFTGANGWGTKYLDPSTLPTGYSYSVKNTGTVFFAAQSTTPRNIHAYAFNQSTGFGTKYAGPATVLTYTGYFVDLHPSKEVVATGGISGAAAYRWLDTTGFGTKYAQPSNDPYAYSFKFSSTGNTAMLGSQSGSPSLNGYPFTVSSGFGTKYANPATTTPSMSYYNSVAFTYGATAVAASLGASPWVYAYAFTEGSGFGAKYADPAVIYTGSTSTGGISFN